MQIADHIELRYTCGTRNAYNTLLTLWKPITCLYFCMLTNETKINVSI